MDPMLRLMFAATVFCAVAVVTFVVGLHFIPDTGPDFWNTVNVAGVFGLFIVAFVYGPVLLVSVLMGYAFALYVHGLLKPKP